MEASESFQPLSWGYRQPVKIDFGVGCINKLGEVLCGLGASRVVLITSPSFVRRGVVHTLREQCPDLIKAVYSEITPNPDVHEVDACSALLREVQADAVVALGGGSVMDAAKAASAFATADQPALAYLRGTAIPATHLPVVAIPTTAGTGSEVTRVSVLSDHEHDIKAPLASDAFYPVHALVDSSLTMSVGHHLTASTGFDVLCHATEAYWNRRHQPVCDALAVHAARLVLESLQTACEHPDNVAARDHMMEASVVAGLGFSIPGTTSAHACSYALTRLLGIAHGEACALTIDRFVRINAAGGDPRVERFARLLGYADAGALADAYAALRQRVGLLCDLSSFNLTDEQVGALAQASQHPNLANNPVDITPEMLHKLYEALR